MTSAFSEVKERVPMVQAVRFYGYTPNGAGFIRCPLHGEKTPSLKIYRDHWYCYGCNKGGSVVDFVGELFGLSPLDAVKRLDADFRLSLPLDRPPTETDTREAQKRRDVAKARERFEAWRAETINELNACFRVAHTLDFKSWDDLSDREALALRKQAHMEYLSDTLTSGTLAEQMEIFRDRRTIRNLCHTILQTSQTRSTAA